MLIRNLIIGLVIGIPVAAIALDKMSDPATSNASTIPTIKPEQQVQTDTKTQLPNAEKMDAIIKAHEAALKIQLKINGPTQENAWNNFIAVRAEERALMRKTLTDVIQSDLNNNLTVIDFMQKHVDFAKQRYDALVKQQDALKTLYDTFNDEQKKSANILLRDTIAEHRRMIEENRAVMLMQPPTNNTPTTTTTTPAPTTAPVQH